MASDPIVRICHEVVEMRAALARHRHQLVEHVHQHGLAAADPAVNVEPLDRLPRAPAFGEQPSERTGLRFQPLRCDLADEMIERRSDPALQRVGGYRTALDHMVEALHDGRMRNEAVAQRHDATGV